MTKTVHLCQNPAIGPPIQLQVSVVAIRDGAVSTLLGVYDVLQALPGLVSQFGIDSRACNFRVELVSTRPGTLALASGVSIDVPRGIDDSPSPDIIIVPSVYIAGDGWETGRYPELVKWLSQMHRQGAVLCSACSGVFLLAETGLLDHKPVTIHWIYKKQFEKVFPNIPLFPEKSLVVAGERDEIVSSGASTSWHDLLLYLVLRYAGQSTAQVMAKFFALQWHRDGLAPYALFQAPLNHGDSVIKTAQTWLEENFSISSPVQQLIQLSGLTERTFKRRFLQATGHSPIDYTQHLRVEEAKRRLEQTQEPIDEIAWQVGYEDPAFFRRLFKRTTGLSPGAYRKAFQVPAEFNALIPMPPPYPPASGR